MISTDKVRDIAKKLLEKSRKGQVAWDFEVLHGQDGEAYEVRLPDASIRLEFVSPRVESDFYRFEIKNADGFSVGVISAQAEDVFLRTDDGILLGDCYAEASRSVHHWDETLDSIEAALNADVPLGEAKRTETADSMR